MVERKPDFKGKDPAALGGTRRTAPEVLSDPQGVEQPGTLIFVGEPCCISLSSQDIFIQKILKISFKQSQTYRKFATMV